MFKKYLKNEGIKLQKYWNKYLKNIEQSEISISYDKVDW